MCALPARSGVLSVRVPNVSMRQHHGGGVDGGTTGRGSAAGAAPATASAQWAKDEEALDLASWQAGLIIRLGAALGGGLAILLPPLLGVSKIAVWRVMLLIGAALALNVWVYLLGRTPKAYRYWYKYVVAATDVALVTGAYILSGSLGVVTLYMVPVTTHAFQRGGALGHFVVILAVIGLVGGTFLVWDGRVPTSAEVVWLIVSAGILLVTALLAVRMSSDLRSRIRATRECLLLVERGDLTARADSSRTDELGLLERSLNSSLDEVSRTISGVQREAEEVAAFAEELAAFSEQLNEKGREFGATALDLARYLDEQRQHTERGTRQTDQALGAAERLRERAVAMEAHAHALIAQGSVSRDAIGRAATVLVSVGERVRESAGAIESLVAASTRISGFAVSASGLAKNTNLLALNAAIEAARAGEHGRGFAVVADEVRKLAEGSARAAREIQEATGSVRDRISDAVKVMSENESRVRDVGAIATEATDALGSMLDGSRKVAEVIAEAAAVSQVQTQAMAELAAVIQEVQSVASEAAARAGSAAGVAQEQIASLDALTDTAQQLARLAERLRSSSVRFTTTAPAPPVQPSDAPPAPPPNAAARAA